MSYVHRNLRRAALVCLLAIALMRILTLGSYPLMDPTESRYAEIGREMVATGDWVTPRLDEAPFWGKPPLSFWMTALSYEVFGQSEFSARLPSFLLAALSVWLTFVLASDLKGRGFGILCALVLASTGLFYVLAGGVMTDPALSASVTLSMVGFALALRSADGRRSVLWGYAFFLGLALSMLSKGIVGWVLTLVPVFVWVLWKRQWSLLFRALPWKSGLLLTFALATPWHLMAEQRTPGFLDYYFVGEHFKRFLVPGWHGNLYGKSHDEPLGSIWLFFAVSSLPWSLVLAAGALRLRRAGVDLRSACREPWAAYLIAWMLTPMLFFTFARNILVPYVLPALPAFAVLVGWVLDAVHRRTPLDLEVWYLRPRALAGVVFVVPLGFSVAAATLLQHMGSRNSQRELISVFESQPHLPHDKLLYVGKQPYSAEFYTEGAAERLEDKPEEIFSHLDDSDRDYFAIYLKALDRVPHELLDRTEEVGRFGKFSLRREALRPFSSASVAVAGR